MEMLNTVKDTTKVGMIMSEDKIPFSGCLYTHEGIKVACDVYTLLKVDRIHAETMADIYVSYRWKQLPLYKRFWYRLKSGIFTPNEWFNFYNEQYVKHMSRWKGKGKIVKDYQNYALKGMIAEELLLLCKAERSCYLNPQQVGVVEELSKLKDVLNYEST